MNGNNKITKPIARELRKLAAGLPTTFADATVRRSVFGHQILERDPDYKDAAGKPLDPHKRYTMTIADKVLVNDSRRLKKIFIARGIEGVREYVDEVMELSKKSMTKVGGLEVVTE